jgi:hypothetical protein
MDNDYSTPGIQIFAGCPNRGRCDIPVIAAIVKCKKCVAELRLDWKRCPHYAGKITCTGKHEACAEK